MPTPGRPATSPCRKRRGCCSRSGRGRPRRTWDLWPKAGDPGAVRRPACCGPIIGPASSATVRPSKAPKPIGDPMAAELDGPRLEPRAGGAARQLVVFLHGYGADGNDLIDVGRAWQGLLPQAAFVSPHAPELCAQAGAGKQWFALFTRSTDERWTGVNKAAPVLERFLDAELARRQLPPSALMLVGFSQGTMMALHVGLRRHVAPLAIVGYSGVFVVPTQLDP